MNEKKFNKWSIIISLLALTISLFGLYFQFFYTKRSISFTALMVEHNDKKDIEVPLIFSNEGNKEEMILNSVLYLELKTDSVSYYKRISTLTPEQYPFILSPNENKLISLKGNYKEYFQGLLLIENGVIADFCLVTNYSNLELVIDINYISSNGSMNNERQRIAFLSFTEDQNISLIRGEPIKLKKLEINTDRESAGYYTMPKTYENHWSINLKDTIFVKKNKNRLQYMENLLDDSLKYLLHPK